MASIMNESARAKEDRMIRIRATVSVARRWVRDFLALMLEGMEQQGKDYYWWHNFGDY